MTWNHDMTAAPRDGTRVLLAYSFEHSPPLIVVGKWCDDRYASKPRPYWTNDKEHTLGKNGCRRRQPDAWSPLPPMPQPEAAKCIMATGSEDYLAYPC